MALSFGERAQAVLFALAVIASVAGLYAATLMIQPAAIPGATVHDVHLRIEGADWTIRYDSNETANNTAFSILLEASVRLGFSVSYVPYQIPNGYYVTGINGSMNGAQGRYWQYWVNDVYPNVGADHMALHDDDLVLWRFTPSQEGS